jgi:hypothetical protein
MTTYAEFFLNTKASVVQLELLEISHPNFSQVYRIVRNSVQGVTVKLETGSTVNFQYYPLQVKNNGSRDDLDQSISFTLGDLGEILPKELDAIAQAKGFGVKPKVVYRTYRSDDLTAPLFGPINLEVESFAFNREGVTFNAKAPSLNVNKTGELYTLERFPMLRGFL